jgi:hypothetical protein
MLITIILKYVGIRMCVLFETFLFPELFNELCVSYDQDACISVCKFSCKVSVIVILF